MFAAQVEYDGDNIPAMPPFTAHHLSDGIKG